MHAVRGFYEIGQTDCYIHAGLRMFSHGGEKYMNLRSIGTQVFGAAIVLASSGISSNAQVAGSAQSNSATHVAAEMTKGKLNPADSKPGDTVALKLKDDVRSNGEVVLKKGTM